MPTNSQQRNTRNRRPLSKSLNRTSGDLVVGLSLDDATHLRLTPESADIPWVQRGVPQVLSVGTAEMPVGLAFDGNDLVLEYAGAQAVPETFRLAPNDEGVRDRWGSYLAPFEVSLPAPTAPPDPAWIAWAPTLGPASNEVTLTPLSAMPGIVVIGTPTVDNVTQTTSATAINVPGGVVVCEFTPDPASGDVIKLNAGGGFLWDDGNNMLVPDSIALP